MAACLSLLLASGCTADDSLVVYTQAPQLPEVRLVTVATGLDSPLAIEFLPEEPGRAWVADQIGTVSEVNGASPTAQVILDLRDRIIPLREGRRDERGLIGMALPPDESPTTSLYLMYSTPTDDRFPPRVDHIDRISEFKTTSEEVGQGHDWQERILLEVPQPRFSHNGGQLAFGPDGLLYVGVGDGGGRGDPLRQGQNERTHLGTILRLDPETEAPYQVQLPGVETEQDQPPEIFAFGFRNPYRFSFVPGDPSTLLVADVGEQSWEEINLVVQGGNYGWNLREGRHCFDPETLGELPSCPNRDHRGRPLIDPILEYPHSEGAAIVGVIAYQGQSFPALRGSILFADFLGKVFVGYQLDGVWEYQTWFELAELDLAGTFILSLALDPAGEPLLLTSSSGIRSDNQGSVLRITP
jgi:glucose/arabinose dehydrogenase